MSIPMEIRELSSREDAASIAQHLALLYSELFGANAVLSDQDFRAAVAQWNDRGQRHWAFLAVDDAGTSLAFFTLAESFAFFAHGRYGILNELWVNPEARSQGVGEQVIAFCVRFGSEQGWQRIDVSAPPNAEWDRSFAFYQKRGFKLTGRKLKILFSPAPPST
jgi:GNAT superfamily N-acetyltransferase